MESSATLLLTPENLAEAVDDLLRGDVAPTRRIVLGIAGIAGSGKSTLAERLVDAANRSRPGTAAFIPMDGFHLPNAELEARGWKPRKGAPFTYDARAYVELLARYADAANTGGYPVYCRRVHEPVPSEQEVGPETRLIVTEGQYLLSPEPPWDALDDVFTESWWLDVTAEQAQAWLMQRDTSVGRSAEEARAKYQRNDRLNTEYVLAARRPATRTVRWPIP